MDSSHSIVGNVIFKALIAVIDPGRETKINCITASNAGMSSQVSARLRVSNGRLGAYVVNNYSRQSASFYSNSQLLPDDEPSLQMTKMFQRPNVFLLTWQCYICATVVTIVAKTVMWL